MLLPNDSRPPISDRSAHAKSHDTRGAGGGELANVIPLCRFHHSELHQTGRKSFGAKHGVNLHELAQEYTLRWQIEAAPGGPPSFNAGD